MESAPERIFNLNTLSEGGEMGELIQAMDWAKTPLGPIDSWSPSLKMMVRFLLANRFPLLLWWGPEFIQIYNDAYRPVLGTKHPYPGLGRPVSECWSEIWHVLRPLIETPFNGGPATWMEDIQLEINRYGFVEESHFTIAYSPVPDETVPGGIGGVLATVHEITEKVVGERRMMVLRDLGTRAVETKTAEAACDAASETLSKHPEDIPFASIYLIESGGQRARLASATGVESGSKASPLVIELNQQAEDQQAWPLFEAAQTESMSVVDDLADRFGISLPKGPWSDPPRQAVVIPILSNVVHQPAGFLFAGISSRLKFDESYRSFMELAASQMAGAIASARAYEEARNRAEALAEIDRAKTVFFSNVSHEFRTPLTLMLGPLEDRLAKGTALAPEVRTELELVHRNGLRLQKLVNTLLDFSRIEAGRFDASFEPVDLGAYTAELASVFRSAIEAAGLRLIVNCPPLAEDIYIDRQMWEKIVLNLISNAFKFTPAGEIEISIAEVDEHVELVVRDTGIGIPAEEVPRLFERFHRVKGAQGRTNEGTGIGLALAQELVKLHGGTVKVSSELSAGTTFAVSIPKGNVHLPPDRIENRRTLTSTSLGARPFVEELMRWLPDDPIVRSSLPVAEGPKRQSHTSNNGDFRKPRILLADDNADIREYVGRLLLSQNYEVETVRDGEAALQRLQDDPPDLVLADVMMPRLDGFGLLAAIRSDERTRLIPVLMLSARAGEESKIEGLEAGADDYLIKPFSARELLARVEAHLNLRRVRREAAQERELLLKSEQDARAAAEDANRLKDEFLATLSHELRNPLNVLLGYSQILLKQPEVSQSDSLRQIAETLIRNPKSQSQLVNDLLDLSRLQMGKVSLGLGPVWLSTMIENAIETVRAEAAAKQITIDLELGDEKLLVSGDALRLQQVAWNLLNNAMKFTPAGGAIKIGVMPSDNFAVLTVEDTGQGIDAAFLPHVFDMFRQADAGPTRRHAGMGIGLALVKQLVELHEGSVEARSGGPGKGAQFIIRLPLLDGERPTHDANPARRELPALKSMTILVVDDSEDTVEMLRFALEGSNASVITASSGEEALRLASENQFDVILSDISMPGMDGFELLSRLRALPTNQTTPVLALTGFGRAEDIEHAASAGFAAHFTKPLDLEGLTCRLSKYIRANN